MKEKSSKNELQQYESPIVFLEESATELQTKVSTEVCESRSDDRWERAKKWSLSDSNEDGATALTFLNIWLYWRKAFIYEERFFCFYDLFCESYENVEGMESEFSRKSEEKDLWNFSGNFRFATRAPFHGNIQFAQVSVN